MKYFLLIILSFLISCAGPNPNPGERTADLLWTQYKFENSLDIIKPRAENGLPWAQLRLGIAYQLGGGVKQDFGEALKWYKKVAIRKADGGWSNGKMIGSFGKPGYFNQNSDAMVAQYQIATIYLKSNKKYEDVVKAYLWANYVLKESKGQNIFYCCEFMGGRWITRGQIQTTSEEINKKITPKQKKDADLILNNWAPIDDL